ncbi:MULTISPECIES: carbamoyl phosphate synthase large subunit [Metabacillus]|uniref:Carbamoyl phosphate synthase large chain n=2 Tax=Metabacillus TaxID=2675233 RepID=A0A179SUA2_9BACI|nr:MULTISPECIES: carbamoyl phosphate synthase large subunit [Metabacillus]OAS83883.1 carbamoyl phosphate synthase large subunit [Metabacillus litoralis]QNF28404.1 carbamoyl phosphate synthase large subunit [Metabacillus sp. KUDC1714]
MSKNQSIKKIVVIGSGPIIIGQAAEFDYAGTQGCLALKEEGYTVVLVNNNPATIMTDEEFSDVLYFEPLTIESVTKIIAKERPDGLLASLGGQTGLNLAMELHEAGVLEKYGVQLLGTSIESIRKGEDRNEFRQLMYDLNEPIPESSIVTTLEEAFVFSNKIGFPIIIRPAYTLGGKGGGIANDEEEFKKLVKSGLQASPITQCLIEKSIAGFKEVEYEMIRDQNGTCISVCNMENIDPVGVHTGDSIVVAPSQTLTDQDYHMLRSAAVKIVSALGVVGGCNIQLALDPKSKQYYVIEVNPRVSRSSALASKATGYPIAKIAAKLAVGYTLEELKNPLTMSTYASFEPALDYVVVKFPRWPFDKFNKADRKLGTKMKATGEVMAIERNLEAAIQKACDSLELDNIGTHLPELAELSTNAIVELMNKTDDRRFFAVMELIRRGMPIEEIHQLTEMDLYFLSSFKQIVSLEQQLKQQTISTLNGELLASVKEKGFSDRTIASLLHAPEADVRKLRLEVGVKAAYKYVDTCAAEFEARTNYFYSTYFGENEQPTLSNKKKILIIGSGPIRIGQGIEFDYSAVHGIKALKQLGYEAIMINNNPETVSTDFETADRLYFEPITLEHVLNIVESEKIDSVIVQYGGQTAINLAEQLEAAGVTLLGTDTDTLDWLEDRDKFYQLLDELSIPHAVGLTANNADEAVKGANEISYPVLLRPSYVIGGKGMVVVHNEETLTQLLSESVNMIYPVLIDQFVQGLEGEIDLISDGKEAFIPTHIEHVEPAGVHSGDSLAILPSQSLTDNNKQVIAEYANALVKKLNYRGIMNIQFLVNGNQIYILEVNPRASRTAPIISKVTGIPIIKHATYLLCGKALSELTIKPAEISDWVAVKYPVFSSHALHDVDITLGPEMKATGEGMCVGQNLQSVYRKIFYKDLQDITSVYFDIENDEAIEATKQAGLQVNTSGYSSWIEGNKGIFVSLIDSDEAKLDRQLALEKGMILFTNLATYYACLQAIATSDDTVLSIQQLTKKEVVKQ